MDPEQRPSAVSWEERQDELLARAAQARAEADKGTDVVEVELWTVIAISYQELARLQAPQS
jgi:hypothetical protein